MAIRSSTAASRDCGEVALSRESVLAAVMSRRDVAKLFEVHPDSISRFLVDGLGAAVVGWGGHGKEMQFSRQLVERWRRARACRRRGDRGCVECFIVLESDELLAAHLLDVRHGAHEHCVDNDECGYPWAKNETQDLWVDKGTENRRSE